MAKKANPRAFLGIGPVTQVWSDVKTNKSLHAVFGIALTFLAGFAWLSSVSSLLSWSADYSAFEGHFSQILWDPEVNMANAFGKLGVRRLLFDREKLWLDLPSPLTWTILLA